MNSAYTTLTGLVIFLALFIYFSYFVVSLKIEKNETEKEVAEKRKKIPFRWRDLIDKKNSSRYDVAKNNRTRNTKIRSNFV